MCSDVASLAEDFRKVAGLAGVQLEAKDLRVESQGAPHRPPTKLPAQKMAVYIFCYKGRALKIGKAGPNSAARYTSQHYSATAASSTLAKSLLQRGSEVGVTGINEQTVGNWVRENTHRFNFLLDSKHPIRLLTLLESFLQCRLDPVFEGFSSQR